MAVNNRLYYSSFNRNDSWQKKAIDVFSNNFAEVNIDNALDHIGYHDEEYIFIDYFDIQVLCDILLTYDRSKYKIYIYVDESSIDVYSNHFKNKSFVQLIEKGILNEVDGIFVPSVWYKLLLSNGLDLNQDKIQVVGYPVDKRISDIDMNKKLNQIIWPYGLSYDDNFSDKYGLEFLVRLIEYFGYEVDKEKTGDLTFLIYLFAREITTNIKRRVANSGIKHEFILSDHNCTKMNTAKIVLSTSIQNSFDPLICKGINRGCHPLAPNKGCYPEMLERGHFMYQEGNLKDCAEKILFALNETSDASSKITKYGSTFQIISSIILS